MTEKLQRLSFVALGMVLCAGIDVTEFIIQAFVWKTTLRD
jgi:hypothetical protein